MNIVSAEYNQWGGITVVYEGQKPDTVVNVPPDPNNMQYRELLAWEAEGNVIEPYVPPPPADEPELTLEKLDARIKALEAAAPKTSKK